jgi:hypothetical protein
MACTPYYFPSHSLEAGKKMFEHLTFNYHAAGWWQKKAAELNFNAVWIPKNVNTLGEICKLWELLCNQFFDQG